MSESSGRFSSEIWVGGSFWLLDKDERLNLCAWVLLALQVCRTNISIYTLPSYICVIHSIWRSLWNCVFLPGKAMAPHSSTLAWKILWMEEPGRLQSMGSLRVGHDWAASLSLFTFMHWRRKWQPTPVFCLENPRDGGAWWAAVYGVAHSRTRLKWLSSSNYPYNRSCNLHGRNL